MAIVDENTPRRDREGFAIIRRVFGLVLGGLDTLARPKPPGLGRLNDHLARDIGLSPAHLEELRHKWPSETTHHPRV